VKLGNSCNAPTNEDDAGWLALRQSASQLEDATNGLVGFTVPLALNCAGLHYQEESFALLGKGLWATPNRSDSDKMMSNTK